MCLPHLILDHGACVPPWTRTERGGPPCEGQQVLLRAETALRVTDAALFADEGCKGDELPVRRRG